MGLIVEAVTRVFDTEQLKKGSVVYARHRTWADGRLGLVTAVTGQEIKVQYLPGIADVTNHFYLPAGEVANGEWELRWSEDLTSTQEYKAEGGEQNGT